MHTHQRWSRSLRDFVISNVGTFAVRAKRVIQRLRIVSCLFECLSSLLDRLRNWTKTSNANISETVRAIKPRFLVATPTSILGKKLRNGARCFLKLNTRVCLNRAAPVPRTGDKGAARTDPMLSRMLKVDEFLPSRR